MPESRIVLTTSYNLAEANDACREEMMKLRRHYGMKLSEFGRDTPVPLVTVLDVCGLDAALWALRAVPPELEAERDRIAWMFAADCAAMVLHLAERDRPDDGRPRAAIIAARRFAHGEISCEELQTARDAARAVAWAVARDAAWAVAWAVARAAIWAAAWAVTRTVVSTPAWAASAAAWARQADLLRSWLEGRAEPIPLPPESPLLVMEGPRDVN